MVGCEMMRNDLVESNIRIIEMYVKIYARNELYSHANDLYEAGAEALMKAAEIYSPDRNCSFEAFASVCVKNAILSYIRAWMRRRTHFTSLDTCVDSDDDESKMNILNMLQFASDDIANGVEDMSVHREIHRAIQNLPTSRERQIISMRYLYGRKQTDIAKSLHVSQAYVSKVEKAALVKMKAYLIDKI